MTNKPFTRIIDIALRRVITSESMESVPYAMRPFLPSRRSLAFWLLILITTVPSIARAATPNSIQTIYVIPSSHWDLGFLRPPVEEEDLMKPHLDAVIEACASDPQFRWTIENGWQLEAWLERTKDPAQIRRMGELLRSGQIELSAAYGSMHTSFMGSEELNRLISAENQLTKRFGIKPTVAMMNDVPGFSLRVPQVLARSGIRRFMTGSNIALGGGISLWPGKEPFYWESPDGSRVLTWQTQGTNGGYTEGLADYYLDPVGRDPYTKELFYPKSWTGLSNIEVMQRGVDKLLKRYMDAGYQGTAVAVFFMHDGIGPEYELKGLLPSVREWNASGRSPHIIVATPSEFFSYIEAHGAQNAPTYQGDWSGLWSRVKLNSPAMSADARALQHLLPQAETLWSLLAMQDPTVKYPSSTIHSGYEGLFVYDEHNGAGQGGWPKLLTREQVLEQNREYSEGLRSGHQSASALLHDGIARLAPAISDQHRGQRMLLVYNPHSWAASPFVHVPNLQGSWSVRDAESGAGAGSQQLATGDLLFEARNLPAVGYRTYLLQPSVKPAVEPAPADPAVLESPYYRVELDPADGAVLRITDLRNGRVIVDAKHGGRAGSMMLNSALYEEPRAAGHTTLHRERGTVVDRVVISRPDSLWPKTIISLPQHEPAVRFAETLDRSKMRFVANDKQSDIYSFAFDFSFEGKVQRRVDSGEGLYRIPGDLLPGSRQDAVVPRHALVWNEGTGASAYHITLAQKEAFFDRFLSSPTAGTHGVEGVLVDVLLKSDQAETQDQGVVTFATYEPGYPTKYHFEFALTSAAGQADPVAVHQFRAGDESTVVELPPSRQPDGKPNRWARSLLSVNAPNVIVEVLKPSSDGSPDDFMLRLQEIAGRPTEVSLKFPLQLRAIAETTMTEDRILRTRIQQNAISISPYQTLTLRLSVALRNGAASKGTH